MCRQQRCERVRMPASSSFESSQSTFRYFPRQFYAKPNTGPFLCTHQSQFYDLQPQRASERSTPYAVNRRLNLCWANGTILAFNRFLRGRR
jgi:hypothetical protein